MIRLTDHTIAAAHA